MVNATAEPQSNGKNSVRRRSPLASLRHDIEGFFGNFWDESSGAWYTQMGVLSPPMDVTETDTTINIRVDLPGIEAKSIEVKIVGDRLTISGERTEEKGANGEVLHRVERRVGRFARSVQIHCAIEEGMIDATYRDGVLTITLPKVEESKSRSIEVRSPIM